MVSESTGSASQPGLLEFDLTIDDTKGLIELTSLLGEFCAQVEARHVQTVVLLRLVGGQGERRWPGAVQVQDVNRWERAVRRFEHLSAILVAAPQGECGGPALDLLLASDYRIASPDMRLQLPINDGQFWPGMSLYRLVHHIGSAKARQLVLWGREIAVDRCLELGLIDQVSGDLHETVRTTIRDLALQPGSELAIRRRLLLEATSTLYEDALGTHLAACDRELRRLQDPRQSSTVPAKPKL